MSETRLIVVALVGLLLPTALMQSQRDLASTESTSKLPSTTDRTTSAVLKPAETTSGEEDILISIQFPQLPRPMFSFIAIYLQEIFRTTLTSSDKS